MPDTKVELDKRATNHCLKVLRLRSDHPIELFCGDGYVYQAHLIVAGKQAFAQISQKQLESRESPLHIHLGQGLARNDRMDWIIQKAVECGVNEVTPLITEKSLIKIKEDRLDHKLEHWQNIIISACEQSGRNVIPKLNPPQRIDSWLAEAFEGPTICFDPTAQESLKSLAPSSQIRVLLGPESGFSPMEIKLVQNSQVNLCHLGARVLRTETATVASLVALQTMFGDFG